MNLKALWIYRIITDFFGKLCMESIHFQKTTEHDLIRYRVFWMLWISFWLNNFTSYDYFEKTVPFS